MDQEILEGFREEANQILTELAEVIGQLEDYRGEFPATQLGEFSQKIDRIMGAAKTLSLDQPGHLGLKRISQLAEICKSLGYRAAETKDPALIPVFSAFWADTLEVMAELIGALDDEASSGKIAGAFSAILQKRLQWLSDKTDQSAAKAGASADTTRMDIAALLKDFGI